MKNFLLALAVLLSGGFSVSFQTAESASAQTSESASHPADSSATVSAQKTQQAVPSVPGTSETLITGPESVTCVLTFTDGRSAETRTVPLTQKGNVQTLTIPADSIPAGIQTLEVHHPWATAKAGEKGFYVFCTGMFGTFQERPNGRYTNPNVIMPIFGVSTPRGAMTVVMTGLRYEAKHICDLKDGTYRIYPYYDLSNLVNDRVYADLGMEFHLLPANATYSDMARVYRNCQLASGTVKPLKEKIADRPELAYAASALELRLRLGWKPVPSPVKEQTAETEPPMKVAITFDRFRQIVDELKRQGVDRAELCLVGWNVSGHDGRYPQIFPADERLGGTEKMKEAIRYAQEKGFQVVCHTNYTGAYSVSALGGRWDENYLLRQKDGSLSPYGATWSGGQTYKTCPKEMFERFPKEDFPALRACGFHGIHYIDVFSTVNPRTCFSKDHPLTKEDWAFQTRQIFAKTQKELGGMGSEGGFDYAISNLDYSLYISFFNPGSKLPALIEKHVPFWHIVYDGIVLNNPYCATTNYSIKDPVTRMKLVEFGGRPMFYFYSKFFSTGESWMGKADLTCETDEELRQSVAAIKRGCDEFESMKELQLEFLDEHSEIAPDVFCSTFSNGTRIVCNYSEADFEFEGKTVRPLAYVVLKK